MRRHEACIRIAPGVHRTVVLRDAVLEMDAVWWCRVTHVHGVLALGLQIIAEKLPGRQALWFKNPTALMSMPQVRAQHGVLPLWWKASVSQPSRQGCAGTPFVHPPDSLPCRSGMCMSSRDQCRRDTVMHPCGAPTSNYRALAGADVISFMPSKCRL